MNEEQLQAIIEYRIAVRAYFSAFRETMASEDSSFQKIFNDSNATLMTKRDNAIRVGIPLTIINSVYIEVERQFFQMIL